MKAGSQPASVHSRSVCLDMVPPRPAGRSVSAGEEPPQTGRLCKICSRHLPWLCVCEGHGKSHRAPAPSTLKPASLGSSFAADKGHGELKGQGAKRLWSQLARTFFLCGHCLPSRGGGVECLPGHLGNRIKGGVDAQCPANANSGFVWICK